MGDGNGPGYGGVHREKMGVRGFIYHLFIEGLIDETVRETLLNTEYSEPGLFLSELEATYNLSAVISGERSRG